MIINEGLRIAQRARKVRISGFTKYKGTPDEICKKIIEDAYNGEYLRISSGHFCEFYVRDFALVAEAMLGLGYKDMVASTLRYALDNFKAAGKVTTSISPDGEPFDFPAYGPDSLALLLLTIRRVKFKLSGSDRKFLQGEVDRFVSEVVDKQTLLPYKYKRFSAIRDLAKKAASCYDATMVGVVACEAPKLKLKFPFSENQVKDRILNTYWNGTYFFADTKRQRIVAGDANVFPFWTGLFTDKKMIASAMTSIGAAGLDDPFPLRYVSTLDKSREKVSLHFTDWFAPDYETDSIWTHLGLAYLEVLSKVDKKRTKMHLNSYTKLLKTYKTWLELYDSQGTPYMKFFYVADEGMSWCASYLWQMKNARKR
ncbi:hypothetical protein GOV11_05335 [Candidatus Woesearchaeota archaeon]|nr:hypothetical protein [Candidatus Woesearchaeota archaeon]